MRTFRGKQRYDEANRQIHFRYTNYTREVLTESLSDHEPISLPLLTDTCHTKVKEKREKKANVRTGSQ